MKKPDESRPNARVIWVGRLVFLWAAAIAVKLAYLQIVKHDYYQQLAEDQQIHIIAEEPDRGAITDRNGHVLAITERTRTAVVNPRKIVDVEMFSALVAPPLELNAKQTAALSARIRALQRIADRRAKKLPLTPDEAKESPSQLVLARHIRPDQEDRLGKLAVKNIEIINDTLRHYPNRTLAAHVVGTLGFVGQDRLLRGTVGVERRLDEDLRGKPALVRALTDARQDRYFTFPLKEGTPGANIRLTIDQVVQNEAEEALAAAVKTWAGKSGFLVALDPQTGAVLALAVVPGFDPTVEKPSADEASLRRNLAVSVPMEPGSVMKMITIAGGIDSGRVTTTTVVSCEGGLWRKAGRQPIHDLHKYGDLSVADVLRLSSNIGAGKVADALGQKLMYEYMVRFGVGERTGIEIPGESGGEFKTLDKWWTFSHEYMAFGHELSMTPVQLARAVAVIANGGKLVQPTLVLEKELFDPATGRRTVVRLPRPEPRQVIKSETAAIMRQLMFNVVEEGTGKPAQVIGYTAGGKTGTAELRDPVTGNYLKNRNASSFIGFAPALNPRIVVVATVYDTPQKGGPAAGPVFAQVVRTALRVMNVPPDKIDNRPALARKEQTKQPEIVAQLKAEDSEPATADNKNLVGPRVPNFRGQTVADVLRASAQLGVPVQLVGNGRARAQRPGPGAILPEGHSIQVEFAR